MVNGVHHFFWQKNISPRRRKRLWKRGVFLKIIILMSIGEELITIISSWTAERIFMINILHGVVDGGRKHITALIRKASERETERVRKTKMVKRGKFYEEACVFMRWFNQHVNTYILLCSHIHQAVSAIVWYDFVASHEFEWDLIYW